MITHLHIRDFAIIQNIDTDFHTGFNVITGETGAGKSIIIEAVSLALGARADRQMVRSGADKALIQLIIDESEVPEAFRTGAEIITREISANGKSICRVDGEIVTLAQLQEVVRQVADIHGQYEQQSLLYPERHLEIIDLFGAKQIRPAKARVADAFRAYSQVERLLFDLENAGKISDRERDFIQFEIDEINAAAPNVEEFNALCEQVKIQQHSEQIWNALSAAYQGLGEGERSALDTVSSALGNVQGISNFADSFSEIASSLSDAYYALQDQVSSIRNLLDNMDFSRHTLDDSIARMDVLNRLVDKYGGMNGSIDAVLAYRDQAVERLALFTDSEAQKAELTEKHAAASEKLSAESEILSTLRKTAAETLVRAITQELSALNFSDAQFDIRFTGDASDPACFSESGTDKAEFLLSANKGQPLISLAKFASGGEMSRIMLAFKSVIAAFDYMPTMIFDEIDSGISGVTASIVGEKLIQMAKHRQILCITHLPQIAALAEHHYKIEKQSDDATTYTTMIELKDEARVSDIARLLGGKNVTETTLKTAHELLSLV
ncbi:MAG: DNA repair protein RecN [Clostridiales Family XIII bacterium]|jgi:DNA repair protein RecN (Recombination protein N)|nr:DNA repair protein RecN [Clostridiales Family XIII bacterium]